MNKTAKIIAGILIALIVGSSIGIGSAFAAVDVMANRFSIHNGPWQASLAAGSPQADPYTRASIAMHYLLALNQFEVIYYNAYKDDNGDPLQADCTYRIEGKTLDTRWWSITAYGADDFLIPNELNRYSYNMDNVKYDADNNFVIYLSKTPKTDDWLPLGDQKTFSLSLRLYNPGQLIRDHPDIVELPHIIMEGCK
ncbi:MAG: DUF1214 domain-containing protein [Dehalococcoidia bacterium]